MRELIIDNFAGGGGASCGIEAALGVPIDIAINHDRAAIEMHKANHPGTKHYTEDIWEANPLEVTKGRPVGLAWFSPDCTHFSRAKGGRPVEKKIRGLAWVVLKWVALVRPRVIVLENVAEFQEWGPLDENNKPCPERKGYTFGSWIYQFRKHGYQVEFRELTAADYGAPTIRKRLFLIARCDGQPIVWPEPTHGPGLKPYRAAAECIDFSLPCHSIFLTKAEAKAQKLNIRRPLKPNTMRRIAKGLRRYVLEAKEPFIVRTGHYSNKTGEGRSFRGQSTRPPLGTVCSVNDKALVMPYVSGIDHSGANAACVWDPKEPLRTVTQENRFALVTAFLIKYFGGVVGASLEKPAPTVTAIDHNALVAVQLMVNTTGNGPAGANKPLKTICTGNHHCLVESFLTKFYGTGCGRKMKDPMITTTAQGLHVGEVRAVLIKYYGTNVGHSLRDPCHTVTSKHRLGLVTVAGQDYQIADIGLRMLQPRELARAQGFPDSYMLTGTKTSQVAKIGNSVCPPVAMAVVKENIELQDIKLKAAI